MAEPQWTSSRVRFNPPPDASLISNRQLIAELRNVGTFNPEAFNEVRQNGAPPLGADGFVPGSLLSLFAFPQTFFHSGAADSLDAVMQNVVHRSAGTRNGYADRRGEAGAADQVPALDRRFDTRRLRPTRRDSLAVTSPPRTSARKLAPDSLASGYGSRLAAQAVSATTTPLPVVLGGTTVLVQDAAGCAEAGPRLSTPGPTR